MILFYPLLLVLACVAACAAGYMLVRMYRDHKQAKKSLEDLAKGLPFGTKVSVVEEFPSVVGVPTKSTLPLPPSEDLVQGLPFERYGTPQKAQVISNIAEPPPAVQSVEAQSVAEPEWEEPAVEALEPPPPPVAPTVVAEAPKRKRGRPRKSEAPKAPPAKRGRKPKS